MLNDLPDSTELEVVNLDLTAKPLLSPLPSTVQNKLRKSEWLHP